MGGRGKGGKDGAGGISLRQNPEGILGTKIAGPGGSNPGGVYRGADGVDRYVKFYSDPLQAYEEHLANQIYNDLGIGAPDSIVATIGGKVVYASVIMGGEIMGNVGVSPEAGRLVAKGFAADVLTANWDAVGLVHDNILLSGGKAIRIDNGGSFLHRAKGARKPDAVVNQVTEWEGFFGRNPEYSQVMRQAGYKSAGEIPGIKGQVSRIVALRGRAGGWSSYVDRAIPHANSADRRTLTAQLEARTKLLQQKVGL